MNCNQLVLMEVIKLTKKYNVIKEKYFEKGNKSGIFLLCLSFLILIGIRTFGKEDISKKRKFQKLNLQFKNIN